MTPDSCGQTIRCDGKHCGAETFIPIALRPRHDVSTHQTEAARGWLFIVSDKRGLHFCPICARRIHQVCADEIKQRL